MSNTVSSPSLTRREERALAFHFVYAAEQSNYEESLESIMSSFASEFNITVEQDSFAVQMAKGAIENREKYDELIKPFLKNWKLERLGVCTHLILRLALWELFELKDAVPNVIINEAIELAKGFAERDAYKFINGILDEVVKAHFPTIPAIEDKDKE